MIHATIAAAESGKAGPLGLLVLVLLCLACYLLFKSMSRHLRKVRDEWPGDQRISHPTDGNGTEPPPSPDKSP
jgi:hypothetical protein